MSHKIFVNLPVKDLNRSKDFFSKLGFSFNPEFTDDKGACLVIDADNGIFAMLLVEKFFESFLAGKKIAESDSKETLIAVSVDNREQVDEFLQKAIAAGGKEFREKQDYGWMYARALQDLDNHVWEIFFMDEKNKPKNPNASSSA